MQLAVPPGQGAMAAVLSLDPAQVAEACREAEGETGLTVAAANLNSPTQTVISGALAAVEKASALAKAKGARRAVLLPVSAPFHCALMQPAQEEVARVLGALTLADPASPSPPTSPAAWSRPPTRSATPSSARLPAQCAGRTACSRWWPRAPKPVHRSGPRQSALRPAQTDRPCPKIPECRRPRQPGSHACSPGSPRIRHLKCKSSILIAFPRREWSPQI